MGDALEDYVGVSYTPALLAHLEEMQAGEADLGSVAAPPMTLGPDTVVSDAIDQFQANNQELALVFDGGEVVGLLTSTTRSSPIAVPLMAILCRMTPTPLSSSSNPRTL